MFSPSFSLDIKVSKTDLENIIQCKSLWMTDVVTDPAESPQLYYLNTEGNLKLPMLKKSSLTHINHFLFSQLAVCSELDGHRGNWAGTPHRASDCLSVSVQVGLHRAFT